MKLTPEQLAVWFYTAFPALTGASFPAGEAEGAADKWIAEFRAKTGRERTEAISGMRQGVNDMLAMVRHAQRFEIDRADAALSQRGLPTIRKMAAALSKKHLTVLKRGFIKNDEEFYLVAEILSDQAFEIGDRERAALGELSLAYEKKRGKGNGGR